MFSIVILGPTGVGKSDFAVSLAKNIGGEIISADSCQVYKHFNIGTAKIVTEEMNGIKHHLIDIFEPSECFNAHIFQKLATEKIIEIWSNNKFPIICGGTGLYIKGLIYGYNFNDTEKNIELRNKCEQIIIENGIEYLYEMLKMKDPVVAEKINKNDKTRIIRALETNSNSTCALNNHIQYDIYALNMNREQLYQRIDKRVDIMIEKGLIEEVKQIVTNYGRNLQGLSSIGYKEILDFLDNKIGLAETVEKIKQHSRNYAKRQLTFIRGIENVAWIEKNNLDDIVNKYKNMRKKIHERN